MNLPNKLTVLRILLVPVFMILYIFGNIYLAAAAFILAAVTDWADGYIARKREIVTNFGKFMDPLADKLLVTGALLCLMDKGVVAMWIVMIILSRDFLINGLRFVAASLGTVIAAGSLGKIKTVIQMIAIIVAIFTAKNIVTDVLMYLAVITTVISGVDYVMRNISLLKSKN